MDEIKNELQKLNELLTSRMNKEKTLKSELSNTNAKSSLIKSFVSVDDPLSLPETPPDDPVVEDSEEITCMQLYKLLETSDNKILIIDVRPQNDFINSHIKNEKCINIPSEEIRKGYKIFFELSNSYCLNISLGGHNVREIREKQFLSGKF